MVINTVYVRLMGGLGNQMFQYAAARALADRIGASLVADLTWFGSARHRLDTRRKFGLEAFSVRLKNGARWQVAFCAVMRFLVRLRVLNYLLKRLGFSHVKEQSFSFEPAVLKAKGWVCLDGYWQSESYFKDIAQALISDFTLRDGLSETAERVATEIGMVEAVSVHVRRGDYITNKSANVFHGVCSIDYYQAAMAYIRERCNAPVFFVFSDDIAWCRERFEGDDMVFVSRDGILDVDELVLMSRCKHNIIANSSFSWWGAWLNRHEGKTVISPKKWFNADMPTQDLIPDAWIRL